MRKIAVLLGLLAVAVVQAGPISGAPIPTVSLQAQVALDDYTGDGSRVVSTNYDNWTSPPSALTGLFRSGSDEIADDLTTVGVVGAGLLDDMGINLANIDAASRLVSGDMAIRFYRLDNGNFISGFLASYNLSSLSGGGLAANSSIRLFFGAGALQSLAIQLPNSGVSGVYVSLQHNTAVFQAGGTLANLGLQTRGPVGVGSSTDMMINVTTATSFNFGGAPVANTGIYLKTDSVPEPATLSLLALGGLALLRRR